MTALTASRRGERLATSLGRGQVPIDVQAIAGGLGLRVVTMRLHDESGLLITQPGATPCIVVNSSEHVTRQRFTIAHELGHFVLSHHLKSGSHVHVDRGYSVKYRNATSSAGVDAHEIEANQFASALLMPASAVKSLVSEWSSRVLHERQIESLANKFAVSVQAMTLRLGSLGLV